MCGVIQAEHKLRSRVSIEVSVAWGVDCLDLPLNEAVGMGVEGRDMTHSICCC